MCQLERSDDGGVTWSSADQPLVTSETGVGGDVLLQADGYAYALGFGNLAGGGPETVDLYRSSDFGSTWAYESDPCTAISSPSGVLTVTGAASSAPGGVFAVLCMLDRGMDGAAVTVSTNGGAGFGSPHQVPAHAVTAAERPPNQPAVAILDGGQAPIPADNLFAAGSAEVLAIVTAQGLSVSHNGGLSWSATYACPVDSDGHGGISFVGFDSASTAQLICDSVVARSTDGGLTWTAIAFPS